MTSGNGLVSLLLPINRHISTLLIEIPMGFEQSILCMLHRYCYISLGTQHWFFQQPTNTLSLSLPSAKEGNSVPLQFCVRHAVSRVLGKKYSWIFSIFSDRNSDTHKNALARYSSIHYLYSSECWGGGWSFGEGGWVHLQVTGQYWACNMFGYLCLHTVSHGRCSYWKDTQVLH